MAGTSAAFTRDPESKPADRSQLFGEHAAMGKKLFVGNLGSYVASVDLQQLFAPHGTVHSAQVIEDHGNGRSRGFGFVEMSSDEEAGLAVAALHGQELDGRAMTVNPAKPWESRTGFGTHGRH
jgi:cold-inducible RNA-binding protein